MPTDQPATPTLAFVGPMVGRHPGYVTSQGLILSSLFAQAGYAVVVTSVRRNRYVRLVDILQTLVRARSMVDVVLLEVYGGPSFVVEDLASLMGQWVRRRIVLWLHGGALPEFMARFPGWSRRVLRRADAIVVPSPYLARAVSAFGLSVQVIPNVIDVNAYPYRHRSRLRPRLFWMRSFHAAWNPAMALRVLAEVRAQVPDATLVMGGQDKGRLPEVRALAAAWGLADAVQFPGFLDQDGKAAAGIGADIFISTAHIDNMPVAVLEACAMGLPVVSTAVGGIPDLLTDGHTGLLVPDNDDRAMAVAVLRLLRDPELAARLSCNGRRLAERSAWEAVQPQWERLLMAVCHGRRGRSG